MRKIIIAAAFVLAANSANACTKSQTATYNLALRLMHTAVDISKTVGGQTADKAVNSLMDLVETIDKTVPKTCRL